MTNERLLGFNVETSDYAYGDGTITNIRTISPIVDCPKCDNSIPIINTDTMSVTIISAPSLTESKFSDLMSKAYFEEDGSTFCLNSYSIMVDSPVTLPDWISLDGLEFTVTSDSPLDEEVSETIQLTFSLET